MEEIKVGRVSKYFGHISVAAIELENGPLKVGDRVHVKGHTTNFEQTVDSIQIEHESVQEAKLGASIGIRVKERVRPHDEIYRVKD